MDLHLELAPEIMFHVKGIAITDTVVSSFIIVCIMLVGAIILRIAAMRAYKASPDAPTGAANLAELIVEGVNGFTKDTLHHHWKPFAPYIATLGIFLGIANIIGMFGFGLKPPTRDFNLPLALATMSILIMIGSAIYYKGIWGFIKSFFEPVWWLFPLKIIEIFARLTSLTARLFGNILAAFIIMEIIIQVCELLFKKFIFFAPGIPPVFSFYFDIFDGLLQAFVFTFLTTIYIEEATE